MTTKQFIHVCACALALGISGTALGQSDAAYDHVVKVLAHKDNHLYIAVAGNFSPDHGCPTPWWAKSQLNLDHAQTKAMSQIALSSLLSRTPIHAYIEGCDSGGRPILAQIQIQERTPPQGTGSTSPSSGRPAANDEPCSPNSNQYCP